YALEEGDAITAVLRFTEALRLDQGFPEHDHRLRIATALRQSPELLRLRTLDNLVLPEPPWSAAVSPDGRHLALLGAPGTVQVWDLSTGRSWSRVLGPSAAVRCLAFHPDGRLVLTQYAKGVAHVWDLSNEDAAPVRELSAPETAFSALSDDGRWLFTLDSS